MNNSRGVTSIRSGCSPRPKFLGSLKKRKPETYSDLLKRYVLNNLLSVIWTFVLVAGGVGLLIHFWTIGYFPNSLELESATALLFAVAITGIVFVLMMAAFLVLPGIIYLTLLDINPDGNYSDKSELHKASLLLGAPILFATAFVVLNSFSIGLEWLVPLWIGLLIIVVIWVLSVWSGAVDEGHKRGANKTFGVNLFASLIVGFGAFLPLFVILLLMVGYEKIQPVSSWIKWGIFFEVVLFTVISNVFVAVLHRRWWLIPFVALFVLMLTMLFTQQLKIIPEASVRLLKLGDVENASLILDQQGCQIACRLGVIDSFSASTASPHETTRKELKGVVSEMSISSDVCQLRAVKILSRMGQEYYLEAQRVHGKCTEKQGREGESDTKIQFNISSSHVLSWSVPLPVSGVAATP